MSTGLNSPKQECRMNFRRILRRHPLSPFFINFQLSNNIEPTYSYVNVNTRNIYKVSNNKLHLPLYSALDFSDCLDRKRRSCLAQRPASCTVLPIQWHCERLQYLLCVKNWAKKRKMKRNGKNGTKIFDARNTHREIVLWFTSPNGQRHILFADRTQQRWKMNYPINAVIHDYFL